MHVTRVQLENIKSHDSSDFQFERGTTAIMGENGAGKTTILEAVAWALFDTLDYNKDDFLRRGAKRGSVRVTFETSPEVDGRKYTVYRDTGTGYYIYDEELGIRLAEKKTDVSAKLRELLGIEPGTDLKALFRSAVGVPQGTFTADFLQPANARKAAFDRLLKVEEYRDGADRLLGTVNLIRERTALARERIAGAEGQLARYDELVREHDEAERLATELESALARLQKEIEAGARAVEEMDRAEQRMTETRSASERLAVERDAALRRAQDLRAERDAALSALERQQALEPDYKSHLAALTQLDKLDAERTVRDRLRAEELNAARLLESARSHQARLSDALERAAEARVQAIALEDDIRTQVDLERERERLRDLRAEALSARERVALLDKELGALRAQHLQTQKRVREAQAGEGAEARVEKLASERLDVETRLSQAEKAATSLKHLTRQREEMARERERLRREIAAREKEAADLERRASKATEAVRLISRETELTEQLAHLKAELARDEKFHAEVKNGLCPILSERCLNIGEGQTLEDYFKGQFATNTAQLGLLEKERARVSVAVREAREAEKFSTRFESVRSQIAESRALLSEREKSLAQIEREIAALPPASREHLNELKAQLSGIDGELIVEREALKRYAELRPMQQRLKEIEQEGKRRRDERLSAAAIADGLAALEKDIGETEERLRVLGDPRARAVQLRREAEREQSLKEELAGASDALRALEEQALSLAAEIAKYSKLDALWETARRERERTQNAHRDYLASMSLAEMLPARERELKKAASEAERLTRQVAAAKEEHERAAGVYDRERHALERAHLTKLRERGAATSAQLDAARERESTLGAELARLSAVREQMREEFLAKERLEELDEATDFIRDVLKQAGPLVTESYLYNVSIEANQLFREITGEAGRSLRWSRDYEIMLEEEGHERSFPNLSGGEQMAAALSVRLALLKQLSDIRIAFFDEPTVNMDARRREGLAQQIGNIHHFDQLFVISHDDTFEESVDHTLYLARNNDGAANDEQLRLSDV